MVMRTVLLAVILAFTIPSATKADELGVGHSGQAQSSAATENVRAGDDELGVGERSSEASGCRLWQYFLQLFGG